MADDLGKPISDSVMMFKAAGLPPLGYKVYTVTKSTSAEEEEDDGILQVGDEIRAGYEVI